MSECERKLCLFRQMEATIEAEDSAEPGSDMDRAFDTPEEFACKVGGCAITGQHLIDYAQAFGHPTPRKEIDKVVAPSCFILDVAHAADQNLARIYDEFQLPPDQGD